MGQSQNLNQFQQAPILGDTATKVNLNTLSVQIDPNSTKTLLAGDAVYMTTTDGSTILVDKCAATQAPFGFILYSIKVDQFTAGDAVEIGLFGQIMYAEADGTIVRGNLLEYVPSSVLATGPRMLASAGVNPISGLALDNASDTDIFRFMVMGVSYPLTATITAGTINGTPIGASSASTGAFTVLTASTSLTVSGNTTTGSLYEAIAALTPGASISLNPTLGGLFTLTPTASCTINAASVPAKSQAINVEVLTSGTTSYTVTFGTNMKTTGTLATGSASGKYFIVSFVSDGTNFIEVSRTTAI